MAHHTRGAHAQPVATGLIVYGLLFIGPLAPVGVFGVLDARTGGVSCPSIACLRSPTP